MSNNEFDDQENVHSGATSLDKTDKYLSDDEEILSSKDETINEKDNFALIQQLENVVAWEVNNFLKEDGTQKGKMALKNDPPVFRISSSDGEVAEFLVTEELSRTLSRVFSDIHKAYYGVGIKGVKGSIEEDAPMTDKIKNWAIENKEKISIIVVLIILSIIAPIIFN